MTFAQPIWLFGLLLMPLLAVLTFYSDRRNRKRLERLVAARLLPDLTDAAPRMQVIVKRLLFLGALSTLLIALARPQFGFTEQEFIRRGRDIMLAVDTSKSMLSTDIAPDRLTRAKLAAQDILNTMKGDRFGLIAFAGASQVEAPLTIDYQTVIDAINQLDPNTVERGGTDIASSIYSAELALGKSEQSYRSLVLFTDGEDLDEDSVAAAKEAAASGIRIFTVGIGTKEGSLIPINPDKKQYLRDRSGQLVRSRLDEKRLQDIAHQTGGFYVHLDSEGISRLVSDGLRNLNQGNIGGGSWRVPIERYRWPLAAGMVLLLLSTVMSNRQRKKATKRLPLKTTVAATFLCLAMPLKGASSFDRYNEGDFDGALERFREELKGDPHSPVLNFNAGDAAYRLRKFPEAFESYAKAMESDDPVLRQKAYYNAGNALFMEGNRSQEIEQQLSTYYDARYQYNQALDLNPRDEQAKKNLSLLEERIKDAEKQKQETARRQQNQRSRRQRKQPSRNNQQKDQKGQRPNQQDDSKQSDDDQEMPGDPSKQSDSSEGADKDGPTEDPSPGQKKDGELREFAPSDQQPQSTPLPSDAKQGQMSEEEALGLLDSLKDEGDKIDLMRRKTDRGVARDW
jgi:Ca-activated chloride channel family protein